MGFTLDFGGLGEGLSDLAEGIALRKKRKEVEGFVGSVNLLNQIAEDAEVTPQEASDYSRKAIELGLQVPDDITDVQALRRSIYNKFPVLALTNSSTVDSSVMALQKQQQMLEGIQGLLPEVYKINPQAAEGIKQMVGVDPEEALKMTKELWSGYYKNISQSFGTGVGQYRAFTEGGGKQIYDYKLGAQLESNKELATFKQELSRQLIDYRNSLGGKGGSKISPLSQVNLMIKFNDIIKGGTDKLTAAKKTVNDRLNKSYETLNADHPDDMSILSQSPLTDTAGRPITNFEILMSGLKGNKADSKVSASQAATDSLINSGRITGTKEELDAINNTFKTSFEPTEPGTSASISGDTKRILENMAVDFNNQDLIKKQEGQFAGYRKAAEDEMVNYGRGINDPQAINALNAYFGASGAVEGIGSIETPSGAGSDLGLTEMSQRIQQMTPETTWQKAKEGIGNIIDKIMPPKPSDENIKVKTSEVKTDESGKVIEEGTSTEFIPKKQSYTQDQVEQFKQTIRSSKAPLSPSGTTSNFQQYLDNDPNAQKLSKQQVEELNKVIIEHNKALQGGGLQ